MGAVAAEDKALEDIEGDVIRGWLDLRARLGGARAAVADLNGRIHRVSDALANPPADLRLPVGSSLEQVAGRPGLIEAQLDESLFDDVAELLDRHDDEMKLGQFGPLMREARQRLLDGPEQAIKGLEGRTRTLENAVQAYRQNLLQRPDLHVARRALNALHRAKGGLEAQAPTMDDLDLRSLSEGVVYIDDTVGAWEAQGGALLAPAGVTFASWVRVLEAVAAHKDLPVTTSQSDALVAEGFLRRVYAVPGGPV